MSMQAELLVIGPFNILKREGVLEYDDSFYDGVDKDAIVLGNIVVCNTTGESRELAEALGIDCLNFSQHHITAPIDAVHEPCLSSVSRALYQVNRLLKYGDKVSIFYRPNA